MKKRWLSLMLALCMVMTLLPVSTFAADIVASGECGAQGENVTWTLDRDGLLTISGSGDMKDYSISQSNLPPWHEHRDSIQCAIITEGVTGIGNHAFRYCRNMKNVEVPDSVNSIGENAFFYCSSLIGVTVPDGVDKIENSVFYECSSLTSITLPDSITYIDSSAFNCCRSLTHISIPYGVTSIGDSVFNGCSDLTLIVMPNTLVSIGPSAFRNCSSLVSISIPDSVTNIGTSAFTNCTSLTGISIPDSITSIGLWMFDCCRKLETVSIPNSVTSIQNCAFRACNKLSDVYYSGSEEQWNSISIGSSNDPLKKAAIHFNSIENEQLLSFISTTPKNRSEQVDCFTDISATFAHGIQFTYDGFLSLYDYDSDQLIERIRLDENQSSVSIFSSSDSENRNDVLTIAFSRESLLPNRHYYIQIDADALCYCDYDAETGTWIPNKALVFPGIGKTDWNFTTSDFEYPHFKNPNDLISFSLCKTLFKPVTALKLRLEKEGTGGTCYGMAYAVGAWKEGYSTLRSISNGTNIRYLEKSSKSNSSDYSFLDYIQLAHLYQYTKAKQQESKNSNNHYEEIYQAINGCISGTGDPVIVGVFNHSSESGHALFPITILSEDDSEIQIQVYDCNKPGDILIDESFLSTLTFFKSGEIITGFSYLDYHDEINFTTIDSILDEAARLTGSSEPYESSNLVSSTSALTDESLLEIRSVAGNAQTSSHLYWTDSKTVRAPLQENQNLSFTDGYSEMNVSATKEANAVLNLEQKSITVSGLTSGDYSYTVEHSIADDQSTLDSVSISGSASGEIVSESRDGGATIKAQEGCLDEVTISVSKGDVVLNIAEFKSDLNQAAVQVEPDYSINVLEDKDQDGEFETVVAEFESQAATEGSCGNNLTWRIDNQTLFISGEGQMDDYVANHCMPWTAASEMIQHVVIDAGVQSIGENAFNGCSELTSVTIPRSVTSIGGSAFSGCSLTDVYYSGTQAEWDALSFGGDNEPLLNAQFHFAQPSNPFKDVPDGKYYTDAVLWAVAHDPQITNGYSDGTFRPDQVCTRAQVVTFLWRAAGEPEPKIALNPFTDVSKSAYYYKAVLWAVENGITTGKNATTFDPTGECTRAHVVTFLWRANGSPNPTSSTNPFKDVPAGKYYAKAVLWALENGVTTGKTADTFNPDGECTRAHVVTFLYRDMA